MIDTYLPLRNPETLFTLTILILENLNTATGKYQQNLPDWRSAQRCHMESKIGRLHRSCWSQWRSICFHYLNKGRLLQTYLTQNFSQ